MMERMIALLMALALTVSLAACGGEEKPDNKENDRPDTPGTVQTDDPGTSGTVQTDDPGTSGDDPVLPVGPKTTTIEYWNKEVEVIELPQLRLSDLHAVPLEGTLAHADSAQDGDVKVYTLESTGRANPGNHGTKEGMTYFLAESSLDIGTSLELHSFHVDNGVRAEKREHNAGIKIRPGGTCIHVCRLFDRDMSEYEVDFKQYDLEKYPPNQADELAAARVYRGVKDPTKLYVFVDATTEVRIEGAMMILLVKDGVIVNSISWDGFGTVLGESRTVDWRFTFEEDYDSVYVQLDINAYNNGETFGEG